MPEKTKGSNCGETAIRAMNLVGMRKMGMTTMPDIVFEMELGYSPVAGGAKAMVSYWSGVPGVLSIQVEYRDPPVGTKQTKVKVFVGDFDGKDVVAFQEGKDLLKDVQESYPEAWARFCAKLPEVLLASEVLRS
jgi:hypothetical protein